MRLCQFVRLRLRVEDGGSCRGQGIEESAIGGWRLHTERLRSSIPLDSVKAKV